MRRAEPQALLSTKGVEKSFRRGFRGPRHAVLRGANLSLYPGESVAISGANGAGKSTLLRVCAHLLLPDAGEVRVSGQPLSSRTRRRVGFCSGDERSFFLRLSAWTNLRFYARLFGVSHRTAEHRIEQLAERLAVQLWLDRPVSESSAGIRARLGLARALIHEPQLLLLDEPTKSQDESGQKLICDAIRAHTVGGNGALLVSHDDRVVRELGARAVSLRHGTVSADA